MGNQPSAKGAPDEEEGGGSEGHEHETVSAYTAQAEIGGGVGKGGTGASPGESRLSLDSASTAPSSSRCSAQGDETPGEGLLAAAGLGEEDRSASGPGERNGEEGGHNRGLEGGIPRPSVPAVEGLGLASESHDADNDPGGDGGGEGGGTDGRAQEEVEETGSVSGADAEKRDATLPLEAEGDQPAEAGGVASRERDSGSGQETPNVASTSAVGEADDGGNHRASVVPTSDDVVLAPLPPAADSPIGNDRTGRREEDGSGIQVEGADEAPAPGTAKDAAREKASAVKVAKAALRIALRSGLASPSDMLNISECSRQACRLCRDGRTFHIKVTANTPLHVWSPPSPPPPLVGAEPSRPWGGNGAADAPHTSPPLPSRFARAAGAGGLRRSSGSPSFGGRHPGGRPLARTGAGIDESANRLSDDGVTKGTKSAAGIARGRNVDPRLGGGARAEKNVAPLRVSRITWDRPEQDLGGEFARELPLDLETLTFAFAFNGSVDGVEVDWPPGMKALHFGMAFNPRPEPPPEAGKPGVRGASGGSSRRVLSPKGGAGGRGSGGGGGGRAGSVKLGGAGGRWSKFLPPGLEEVSFGTHFNQPVEGVKWPSRLKRLLFGANFKQNIEVADWPDTLEELTFGVYFNQPVELVKWPRALKRLVFGTGFNQPVEKCSFPDGLAEITFGAYFNQAVTAVKWPPGLLRVTFGDRFNHPVVSAVWPSSLTHLTFGRGFDQPLQGPQQQAASSDGGSGGGGGGGSPNWPPAGLRSVIVGSKFTGEALPVEESGGSEGGKHRPGGGTGLSVFRRFSPKRSKRRSSSRGIGGGRPGSIKVGQGTGDRGASTSPMVATSEEATTPPTGRRPSRRLGALKG